MRGKRISFISVLMSTFLVGGVALAYSRGGIAPENGSTVPKCGPKVYFRFVAGDAGWTSTLKDTVRKGIRVWENAVDRDATNVVKLVESDSGTPMLSIKRVNAPGGVSAALGFGKCNGDSATLQLKASLSGNNLQGIAAHEVGHVFGLAHTGRNESVQDGKAPPTMVSGACAAPSEVPDLATITHDDHAGVTQRHGDGLSMNANSSFEKTVSPWWSLNYANAERPSGGPQGKYFLRLKPSQASTSNYPRVFQDVFLYRPGNHDAAAYVRKEESSHFGNVFLKTWRRVVSLDTSMNPSWCKAIPTGDYGFGVEARVSPTTSWVHYNSTASGVSGPGYERLVLRVVLRSEMKWRSPENIVYLIPARVDDLRNRSR